MRRGLSGVWGVLRGLGIRFRRHISPMSSGSTATGTVIVDATVRTATRVFLMIEAGVYAVIVATND